MSPQIQLVEENEQLYWQDTDGFRVPVIAGGSDNGVSVTDQIQDALTAGETEAGTEQSVETPGSQQDQVDSDSLANDFLKGIPGTDRAVVEKYVKDWDAGVTKKFQEIHGQYAPYKELGEPEVLSQARELYNILEQNPQLVYEALKQQFESEQALEQQQQQQTQEGELPEELSQYLTPLQQQLEQQNKVVEQLANIILGKEQQSQQEREDQELRNYLDGLKEAHGEFDEHYVLSKMAAGMKGEEAVKAFQDLIQKQSIQQAQSNAKVPPALSGAGAPPPGRSVEELDDKEVKGLITSLLK